MMLEGSTIVDRPLAGMSKPSSPPCAESRSAFLPSLRTKENLLPVAASNRRCIKSGAMWDENAPEVGCQIPICMLCINLQQPSCHLIRSLTY